MSILDRASHAAVLLAVVVVTPAARAAPSNADVDAMFRYVALESRGFAAYAPSFPVHGARGADVRLAFQGSSFGLTLGGRFGGDGSGTQFVGFDAGVRFFLDPRRVEGLYLGGGLLVGAQTVDGFSFKTGSLTAAYGEVGLEWPRDFPLRLTTSLRADVGGVSANRYSRIVPDDFFRMLSLNVGFILGAKETGARE